MILCVTSHYELYDAELKAYLEKEDEDWAFYSALPNRPNY